MNGANICQGNTPSPQKPLAEIDNSIGNLFREVAEYESGVRRLINVLEDSKPAKEPSCGDKPITQAQAPQTVTQAICFAADRLAHASETLLNTIHRIEEQVGEIKILP